MADLEAVLAVNKFPSYGYKYIASRVMALDSPPLRQIEIAKSLRRTATQLLWYPSPPCQYQFAGLDNHGIVGLQRQILKEQDHGLEKLEETVLSIKHITLAVNKEITWTNMWKEQTLGLRTAKVCSNNICSSSCISSSIQQ